jgi:rhodanese-related sulfurtransferase
MKASRRRFVPVFAAGLCSAVVSIRPVQASFLFYFRTPTWASVAKQIEHEYPNTPSVTTSALADLIAAGENPLLIDVRRSAEYAVSHIANAVNLDSVERAMQMPEFTRARQVIVYCSVGLRSADFVKRSRAAGANQCFNLTGSLFQWANEGRELRAGNRIATTVHPYNDRWGTLLKSQLRASVS